MPELPDIEAYLAALRPRVGGRRLERVRLVSPFLLRSVAPPLEAVERKAVTDLRRVGKRIVIGLEDELFIVIHLMIAGRLRWEKIGAKVTGKIGLAAFDFDSGTLLLTEASPKKRASLHVVRGEANLAAHDPGGIEPLSASVADFAKALRRESHTVKRSLTDPHVLAGIGNAYSNEILHAAGLSPLQLTGKISDEQIERLHAATQRTLRHWTDLLTRQFVERFPGPGDVTAFRPEFAVHGKFGQPCPICGTTVQRIVYAQNETNYCPSCQTGGKLLADRSLSRLLHDDWPKSIDELE